MSQASTIIDHQKNGVDYTTDLNAALAALLSTFSGPTAPASPVAYQVWADTTTGQIKRRNAANTAWVLLGPVGGEAGNALALNLVCEVAIGDLTQVLVTADRISVGGVNLSAVSEVLDTNTAAGPGAIQSGSSWAVNTWYDVRLICNDDGSLVDTLAIPFGTGLSLPTGFTQSRHVTWVRTSAGTATNLLTYRQDGQVAQWEEDDTFHIGPGTSTTFAAVDVSTRVPPTCRVAHLHVVARATAINLLAEVFARRTGSTSANGYRIATAATPNLASANEARAQTLARVVLNSARSFDYRVSPSSSAAAYVAVRGWEDGQA